MAGATSADSPKPRTSRLRNRAASIRTRVLLIALIPSIALVGLGVTASAYLVNAGISAQNWSTRIQDAVDTGAQFAIAVQEERRLTLLWIGGDRADTANLEQQRTNTSSVLAQIDTLVTTLDELNPGVLDTAMDQFNQTFTALDGLRRQVDTGQATPQQAYDFYNQITQVISLGLQSMAVTAPDSKTAAEETTATDLFQVADSMSRSNAMAVGGVAGGGLPSDQLLEVAHQVGTYHTMFTALLPRLTPDEQAQAAALTASEAWQRLSAMETALILRNRLPMAVPDWQQAAAEVQTGLIGIWINHHRYAQEFAAEAGERTFWQSLLGGLGVLLVSLAAFLVALRLANQLVDRLKRLRRQTLHLAEEELPQLVQRLRDGKQVDPAEEMPSLGSGPDEIGQVADAFTKAQQTAVAAAVQEARTRAGVNAVFLNIAHRSQVVVHRQLEVLDQAERKQEDPDQLELLFKLDHLATRSRRNAENLLILGGSQPGRQWRNPVPLVEVARSAAAETEDYARVHTGRIPGVSVIGAVVADLVHLLAELVDNATCFSPPESRVEVRGNVVGKGIVIEIEDQGLGIPPDELERINHSLHEPPDFTVMSLSEDARLGLFVVAQLAARHDIAVSLTESPYGGTRAVVLLRSNLIAQDDPKPRPATVTEEEAGPPPPAPVERVIWPVQEPPEVSAPQPMPRPAVEPPAPRHAQAPRPTPAPAGDGTAGKPPLPRRRRQTNLAPQLASTVTRPDETRAARDRSADDARNVMTEFLQGTRQAREDG